MKIHVVLLFFLFISECVSAESFAPVVRLAKVEHVADKYELNVEIDYKLSDIAKEALQKGISLAWVVKIKVEKEGVFWNNTLEKMAIGYQIKNHALLNLYGVKNLNNGEKNVFSTLAGALDFISKIRGLAIVDEAMIMAEQSYLISVKVAFEHEALPVPIRPFSYFDSQWALSSDWVTWPFQK